MKEVKELERRRDISFLKWEGDGRKRGESEEEERIEGTIWEVKDFGGRGYILLNSHCFQILNSYNILISSYNVHKIFYYTCSLDRKTMRGPPYILMYIYDDRSQKVPMWISSAFLTTGYWDDEIRLSSWRGDANKFHHPQFSSKPGVTRHIGSRSRAIKGERVRAGHEIFFFAASSSF